jgi:protein subunit release factor A
VRITHLPTGLMEDDLDEMSEALMAADVAERLAALGAEG